MGTMLLDFTKPHLLRDEAEYEAALAEAERLMRTKPRKGSDVDERIEFLLLLIEAYEDKHYPMNEAVSPQDAVEFMCEQQDMSRGELADLLGGRSRLSEFMSGKRPLSMGQIQKLRDRFRVSADLLIGSAERPKRRNVRPARQR